MFSVKNNNNKSRDDWFCFFCQGMCFFVKVFLSRDVFFVKVVFFKGWFFFCKGCSVLFVCFLSRDVFLFVNVFFVQGMVVFSRDGCFFKGCFFVVFQGICFCFKGCVVVVVFKGCFFFFVQGMFFVSRVVFFLF